MFKLVTLDFLFPLFTIFLVFSIFLIFLLFLFFLVVFLELLSHGKIHVLELAILVPASLLEATHFGLMLLHDLLLIAGLLLLHVQLLVVQL